MKKFALWHIEHDYLTPCPTTHLLQFDLHVNVDCRAVGLGTETRRQKNPEEGDRWHEAHRQSMS